MAFLALNGWALPIAQAEEQVIELGTADRAFSGKLRRTRRAVKRQWAVTTAPLSYEDAAALEGTLLAFGEQWRGETDVFSSKGLTWLQDNGITTVVGEGRYGNAWWPRGTLINLFASNIQTGTDTSSNTTGFAIASATSGYGATGGNGTITSSTEQAWQGTRSLKAVFNSVLGTFDAVRVQASVSASTQYTFSCYVHGTGPGNGIDLQGRVDFNAGGGGATIAPFHAPDNAWVRVTKTFTSSATATGVEIKLGENTDSGGTAYFDGWQLEPGGSASAWGTGFAGVNLGYDVGKHFVNDVEGLAISAWAKSPAVGGFVGQLGQSAGSGAVKLYYPSANVMRMRVTSDAAIDTDVSVTWSTPTTYALWTAVLLASGTPNMLLYKDGVLIGSGTATLPTLTTMDRFYLGNSSGSGQWQGYLDEVMLYTAPPTANTLLGLAGLAVAPAIQPALLLQGDIVGGKTVTVQSSDVRLTYVTAGVRGTWKNNLVRVQVTLSEV